MATRAQVDVFRHRDYRSFLREFYQRRKERKSGYSLRAFSRAAGLRSPNYLKLVMDGARNLTPAMAIRFAQSCDLSGDAVDYFCELVAFNQASSTEERQRHYRKLGTFPRFKRVHKLEAAQAAYHGDWYVPVIRELAAQHGFQEDPRWIARQLLPPISPAQAKDALRVLCDLGLLVRSEAGKLVQADALVETPDGPLGHHVVEFHRAMMSHAAQSFDRVPREEREIASLTLCIDEAGLADLKRQLEQIRQSLLQRYSTDGRSDRVVQVNLQMFPVTKKREN